MALGTCMLHVHGSWYIVDCRFVRDTIHMTGTVKIEVLAACFYLWPTLGQIQLSRARADAIFIQPLYCVLNHLIISSAQSQRADNSYNLKVVCP